ncbi:hypothetical protein C3L33_21769, partial [Rhododendron williamsianum]
MRRRSFSRLSVLCAASFFLLFSLLLFLSLASLPSPSLATAAALSDQSDVVSNSTVVESTSGFDNASRSFLKEDTFADIIDRALEKEFTENDQTGVNDTGGFNNSVAEQQAVLETVARVKTKKNDTKEDKPFQLHHVFNLDNENRAEETPTLIDRKDNVFIISNFKSKYPVLQLDLRLISDLVVVIVSATGGGIAFACAGQPVITGYLLAGSLVGPGGLDFVSEMVQVETVAQFGVIFLLFALGLEFSTAKLRVVRAVAVLGGFLQIVLFMFLCGIIAAVSIHVSCIITSMAVMDDMVTMVPYVLISAAVVSLLMLTTGCYLQLCGGKLTEGIFVGVFLSMSSTAVVTLYWDLSLGWPPLLFLYNYFITLMDDTSCWAVGVKIFDGEEQHKFPSWPSYHRNPYFAGLCCGFAVCLASCSGWNLGCPTRNNVHDKIVSLLVVLIAFLAILSILSRTCVPWFLKLMINLSKSSQTNELYQLASVAFCLLVAWCSDKLGLSLELGSFAAGVMISTTDLAQHTLEQVEPIRNLFAALFLASIGMLIHVHFLWNHVDILLASVILVFIVKSILITVVVKGFGYNNRTSVGMSLAQIGEFAFVLLSRASNLHLVEGKLYLLLLGTTALSLVTTPLLFKLIPAVVRLGVLLRWFNPDTQNEIGFKGDLRLETAKQRISIISKGPLDS